MRSFLLLPRFLLGMGGLVWSAIAAFSESSPDGLWRELSPLHVAGLGTLTQKPWIQPENAKLFVLSGALLQPKLDAAPREFSAAAKAIREEIFVPFPDGSFQRFAIENTAVMHPDLGMKFPDIRTFIGEGLDDPLARARFDWTPGGFHGQILKPSGPVYIDPYYRGNVTLYSSYAARDYLNSRKKAPTCHVKRSSVAPSLRAAALEGGGLVSGTVLRTYRLALACTGEYASFHEGTTNAVLAAMVTTVNRVNGIYESEVAVRVQLVPNNDQLVFLNASTDPYQNNDGDQMLIDNVATINSRIGLGGYDIGHVFSTGGGGVAGLGVVCGSYKAEGVTGQSQPVGDPFDIDFVAHEMGHQFDGNHTFNGDSGSCSDENRHALTAYEPGSGSTIQAYAGICGNDDVQLYSDPYFHSASHQEIYGFVSTGNGAGCAMETATGNTPPTVEAGADYTVPRSTPFVLTALGSDDDGDTVTYSWEQFDLGPQLDVGAADNGSSPLFRVWTPTTNAARSFPRLNDLINNTTVTGEKLPTNARIMNFRVTVRDNRTGGGGVSSDDMKVTVDASSGPFQVTFPNTDFTLSGNVTVTWDVANTDVAPVGVSNVDILLSSDGGMTYPVTLASSVPNNGSALVSLPNLNTNSARIRVQGSGNIFFDVSNDDFTIKPASGLAITPIVGLVPVGLEGGPFSPLCEAYTLQNESGAPLVWEAGSSESWASVFSMNGTLGIGDSTILDVCVNSNATLLAAGEYVAAIVFTNLSNATTQQRAVQLVVEPAGGALQFSADTFYVEEGAGEAVVMVERLSDDTGEVSVQFVTSNGTAAAGADYTANSGTLHWGDGDSAPKSFVVMVEDDATREDEETVSLVLSDPSGGANLGTPVLADLVIADNDDNDLCSGSSLVSTVPFSVIQSTKLSTSVLDPAPDCQSKMGNGVWYSYVASEGGTLTIDTVGSSYDTVLAVYTGACGSLVEVACDDDGGADLTSLLAMTATGGETYRVLAGGYNSAVGSLVMELDFLSGGSGSELNDLCSDARVVTAPFVDMQSTIAATSAGDAIPACGYDPGSGIWYVFTAPSTGDLEVDLSGSSFDTVLAIYEGSCESLVEVGCDDDDGSDLTSAITAMVNSGSTYYVLVTGYDGDQGDVLVSVGFFTEDFDGDGVPDSEDLDDDNDGIPDDWEVENEMDPLDPEDAGEDLDLDGATGLEEYLGDTSPTNSLSMLTLRIDPRVGALEEQPLSFESSTGRLYFIQVTDDLPANTWQPAETNIPGNGGIKSIAVTNGGATLHFRLGAEVP